MGQTISQALCGSNRREFDLDNQNDMDGYDIEAQRCTKQNHSTPDSPQQLFSPCSCGSDQLNNHSHDEILASFQDLVSMKHIGTDVGEACPQSVPILHIWQTGPLFCNTILIIDDQSRDAIIIDPGGTTFRELKGRKKDVVEIEIIPLIQEMNVNVKKIVITHAHFDHFLGLGDFRDAFPDATVLLHTKEKIPWHFLSLQLSMLRLRISRDELDRIGKPDQYFINVDGKNEELGFMDAQVIHTPGHSEGSICIHFPSAALLISGDTLFRNAVGRSDLNGGSLPDLKRSILTKLYTLPPHTQVIPGHGPKTMIGHEKANNPSIKFGDPIPN